MTSKAGTLPGTFNQRWPLPHLRRLLQQQAEEVERQRGGRGGGGEGRGHPLHGVAGLQEPALPEGLRNEVAPDGALHAVAGVAGVAGEAQDLKAYLGVGKRRTVGGA